jgi:tetratricopeptide (TPR) repeat protein
MEMAAQEREHSIRACRTVIYGALIVLIRVAFISDAFAASQSLSVQQYVALLQRAMQSTEGPESAIQELIEQVDKSDPVAQVNLGVALTRIRYYPVAMQVLAHATNLAPQNSEAHAYLGFSSFWAGNCDKAIPAFNKAIDLGKGDPEAGQWHSLLGRCYVRTQNFNAAMPHCSQATLLLPSDPRGPICLGKAQYGAAQYEAATTSFLKAYEMTNDSLYRGEARMGALACLKKQNKLDSAKSLLKLESDTSYTKEFLERSATAAALQLERGERWQF